MNIEPENDISFRLDVIVRGKEGYRVFCQCCTNLCPMLAFRKLGQARRLLDLMILSYHTLSLRRCRILD